MDAGNKTGRREGQLPDLDTLSPESLKALVLARQSEPDSRENEIESMKLLILKLKRMQFGPRSEKFTRDIEQLELQLEDLETGQAAAEPAPAQADTATVMEKARRRPARRPLPANLPRETETLAPKQTAWPDCGRKLRLLGENVCETLEYIPARFKVMRTVRPKLSCACCSRVVQEPAPNRVIDRGLAGPALLAHVLVAKFADHLPLYRQSGIYERAGVELDRSTLADWVGGATEIYVAVHPHHDPEPVRAFSTFTEDLHRLADWLKVCRVESVAMESTGVYWIPLFQILEQRGFEVCLVNARYYQNVPGRRTDVADCQWLRHLHSVGLLRASFRPSDQVCVLRSLVRHRDSLIQDASSHVLRMQKALNQMNLQIHHVISDITGVTGLRILDAILAGERDPAKLAALRDGRIKASEATILKSLVGDYRREHLFTLRQSLAAWRNYQKLMVECDREVEAQLTTFDSAIAATEKPLPAAKIRNRSRYTNEPNFDLRGYPYRIIGVDLTAVPGISALTAHILLAEVGPDLSRFRSGAAFASWLGLCPDNDISGGKTLSVKTRHVNNRAAGALRMAVNGLYKSQTWLGNFFRRMRAKLGAPKAVTATAHKLARVIYQLLLTQQPYDESIFAKAEQTSRLRMEIKLKAQAKALGFQLVPTEGVL